MKRFSIPYVILTTLGIFLFIGCEKDDTSNHSVSIMQEYSTETTTESVQFSPGFGETIVDNAVLNRHHEQLYIEGGRVLGRFFDDLVKDGFAQFDRRNVRLLDSLEAKSESQLQMI